MRAFLSKVAATLYAYGPIGILVLSAADSLGIPLPAAVDVMLLAVAAKSVDAPWHAWFTALMAITGSIAGNVTLFQAARQGRRLFSKSEPPPNERRRFREWFHRYGLLTVFIPAVTPVLPLPLKVFVISAGALHTPFRKFVAVIVAARLIRYFGLAWLGLKLGQDAQGFLQRNGWTLAGVAILIAFALVLLIRASDPRRRSRPAAP
jgi:membrane protein DedA with SNARE-associated domain